MKFKDSFLKEFQTSPLESCLVMVLIFALFVFTLVGAFAICAQVYLKFSSDVLTLKLL